MDLLLLPVQLFTVISNSRQPCLRPPILAQPGACEGAEQYGLVQPQFSGFRAWDNKMGCLLRSSLVAVCFLFFSPSLPADSVHSFTDRVGAIDCHSFCLRSLQFIETDRASVGGTSAFFVDRTLGSDLKWRDDSKDHHGNAWGSRKDDHQHHHDGDGGLNFADQDNEDTDGDSGNAGSIIGSDASTSGVPEPSVLVLLSTALAAFLLKSLRRAIV